MTLVNSSKFCNLMRLTEKSIRSVMNLNTLPHKKQCTFEQNTLQIHNQSQVL